ncbi:3-dehydroquinate synthase, partial [filamentous cyanobacterium Phorm 46]
MQSIIKVDLGPQSYNVCVRSGGLDELGSLMGDLSLGKKVLLVSNQSIFRQYGDRATA